MILVLLVKVFFLLVLRGKENEALGLASCWFTI